MRNTNRRFSGPGTPTSVRRFPKHELTAVGLLWMALTAVHAGAQAIPVSTARDLLATDPRPRAELLETARTAPVSAEERPRILGSLPWKGEVTRLSTAARQRLAALRPLLPATRRDGVYTVNYSSLQTAETFGEWSPPVNVGPPLNTAYNDNYAVLSRDELTIYFTSDRPGGFGGDDLWFATRESVDSPWGEPQNMGAAINTGAADSLAVLASNDHVMYFHSTRDGGCGQGDIWMTRRQNKHSDWEEPTNLGCVLNTPAVEIAPAFFEDPETEQATLFYGSNRLGGIGDFDVYASPLGEDGPVGPGMLVRELSSTGRDTRIFVRKDGLEAFVTTNRAGGQGLIDIWGSTRETPSDPWSVPVDLGSPVNSEFDDGSPWLSKDGTTLYFFSARPGGYGKRDIWYTTRVKGDHENG